MAPEENHHQRSDGRCARKFGGSAPSDPGEGVTIAIIDDGVDTEHPEFAGTGKIVAPRDVTLLNDNPRPKDLFGTGPDHGDNHGTACAGVATANGANGAWGCPRRPS